MMLQRDGSARDALIQIDKVLRLEERQGFRDASATIGLARFVGDRTTLLLNRTDIETRRQVQELDSLLADYANLPMHERMASVAQARSILVHLIDGAPTTPDAVASPAQLERPYSEVKP